MKLRAAFLSLCLVALFQIDSLSQPQAASPSPTPTPAQTEEQKELEKRVREMIDQAVSDAAALKVAQNRAVVYALAGDLLWQFDEKRSRELFRNSISELITANFEKEKEKKDRGDAFDMPDVGARKEILPLIAKHDADLALEGLIQTRPAKLAEAIARSSSAAPDKRNDRQYDPYIYYARDEIALEQKFALLAAEQDPEKAIKLFKEGLAKGISFNIRPILDKIHSKDAKRALSLADDVVTKIEDTDLSENIEELSVVTRLFQKATDPNAPKDTDKKKFAFSEAQVKKIANKLARTFFDTDPRSLRTSATLSYLVEDLEKVLPSQGPPLRQRQAEVIKAFPLEFQQAQQKRKIWNPNSTPEDILAEFPKLNEFDRASAGQVLIPKIVAIDDEARAKKLIDQITDEATRDRAREEYESARISRAAEGDKLDDARKQIANLARKRTQIQKLVILAIRFHMKGTEKDRETARGLMKGARAMVSDYPEDEDELNDLMEIILGYAVVDPVEGFRLFEPLVEQINDFLQASAILSKYNKHSESFKKGELMLRLTDYGWGQLIFRFSRQMEMLGKADLRRMALITDKFPRTDARIIARLFVVQGYLKDDKKTEAEMMKRNRPTRDEDDW